jgi:hypothetical protein
MVEVPRALDVPGDRTGEFDHVRRDAVELEAHAARHSMIEPMDSSTESDHLLGACTMVARCPSRGPGGRRARLS